MAMQRMPSVDLWDLLLVLTDLPTMAMQRMPSVDL
jgi:hypothetical protein